MSSAVEAVPSPVRVPVRQGAQAADVQLAVSKILKSSPFRSSKQSQHLLRYIVDQSLAGQLDHLKERIIGAEVFGRPVDYDTNSDPIVRARVAEVRKRLAQFYVGEGAASSVRIEISPGSYFASFSFTDTSQAMEPLVSDLASVPLKEVAETVVPAPRIEVVTKPVTPSSAWKHSFVRWYVAAGALGVALVVLLICVKPRNPLRQFWLPLLETPKPVLIYTGANPVYMPSTELINRFRATHHLNDLETGGHEFLIPLSGDEKFGAGDLVSIRNEFVTIGDVSANVGVATLLDRFDHPFDLRSGEDVSFGDLRQTPAVLIGAFNNAWTLRMTGDLPFIFGSGLSIKDTSDITREWHPAFSSDDKVMIDYALVARLAHAKTGGPLMAIAGITESGTRAAAEFVTSQQGIRELQHSLPKAWTDKNLEFVLQTKVVNDIPTTPTVVAVRVW